MFIGSETNKRVQGGNLTHLLLAEPVSGNLSNTAQQEYNYGNQTEDDDDDEEYHGEA